MGSSKVPVPPAVRPEEVVRVPAGELSSRLYPVSDAVSTQPCGSGPAWAAATVGTRTAAHRPVSPATAVVTVRRVGVLMAVLLVGGGSAGHCPEGGTRGQLGARYLGREPRVGDRACRTRATTCATARRVVAGGSRLLSCRAARSAPCCRYPDPEPCRWHRPGSGPWTRRTRPSRRRSRRQRPRNGPAGRATS